MAYRKRDRKAQRSGGAWVQELECRRLLATGSFGFAVTFGELDEVTAGYTVQADAQGNSYVAGTFRNTIDVDPSPNVQHLLHSDGDHDDIFFAKYTPAGRLIWAHRLGGGDDDTVTAIRLAPNGDVVMVGTFQANANFGSEANPTVLKTHGSRDGFVARFDGAEGKVKWAGSTGGERDDSMTAVAVGADGDVYIAGTIRMKGDINPAPNKGKQIVCRGVDDSFLERLDGTTGRMKWSKVWGENDTREGVLSMAVDAAGNVYATGMFNNEVQFERGNSKFTREAIDGDDVFLAKVNPNGTWNYVKTFGGENEDTVTQLVMGDNGDLYLTGNFGKTANFNASGKPFYMDAISDADAYVARYRKTGQLVWARQFGGDGTIISRGIAVDHAGNVYTAGEFIDQIDFDPGPKLQSRDPDKGGDAPAVPGEPDITEGYVSKLDANGRFKYIRTFGGRDAGIASYAIAANPAGDVYVTGAFTYIADFDPLSGKRLHHTQERKDEADAFILKLNR